MGATFDTARSDRPTHAATLHPLRLSLWHTHRDMLGQGKNQLSMGWTMCVQQATAV